MSLLDLPGTYSLRARSPDEEITRDVVLGRPAGEARPTWSCASPIPTNLRLALRLVLELKSTGRPMVLALNMIDIATRQGLASTSTALGALGVPIVTSIAVRKGGTADLLRLTDELRWRRRRPSRGKSLAAAHGDRAAATHREAERIIAATSAAGAARHLDRAARRSCCTPSAALRSCS